MKTMRKCFLGFLLTLSMIFTSGGMTGLSVIYAEEDITPVEMMDEEDMELGTVETFGETKTEITEEKEKTPDGGLNTITTTNREWSGSGEDGTYVEGSETKKDSVVTDSEGKKTGVSGTAKGQETTTSTDNKSETSVTEESKTDTEYGDKKDVSPDPEESAEVETDKSSQKEKLTEEEIRAGTGDVTVTLNPGDKDKVVKKDTDEEALLGVLPKEGESEKTNEDGSRTITKVVYTKDEIGNVSGYTTTTTVITKSNNSKKEASDSELVSKETVTGKTTTEESTVVEILIPKKPLAKETTDEAGTVTKTVVTDLLDEEGALVGYQTVTTVTDKNGKVLSSSSESIWGVRKITTITKTTPVTTTTVSEKTVTETNTEVITTAVTTNGVQVTATDREVKASMEEILSNNEIEHYSNMVVTQAKPALDRTDSTTDLYHRPWGSESTTYDPNGDKYQWLGEYGLESTIRVAAGKYDTWQPHQFVLVDKDGNQYYVYCADFEVDPETGAGYSMQDIESAEYYNSAAAQKIRAIALKGYWGTADPEDPQEDNTGSMATFKKLLIQSGKFTEKELEGLTPGMAITATQAAIWRFGNSGTDQLSDTDIVGKYYSKPSDKPGTFSAPSEEKETLTNKIYRFLIGMAGEAATVKNTLITENNFAKELALTVKEQKANGKYNVDLAFTLDVVPDDTDNLTVDVLDNEGHTIASQVVNRKNATLREDGKYVYNFSGLELPAANQNLKLSLKGTQTMNEGVYLFTATRGQNFSQTFVGVGDSKQNVDLSTIFYFAVKEATAEKEISTRTTTKDKTTKSVTECLATTTATNVKTTTEVTTNTTDQIFRSWMSTYASVNQDDGNVHEDGGNSSDGSTLLKTSASSVKTGDENMVIIWGALAAAALGFMLVVLYRRKIERR